MIQKAVFSYFNPENNFDNKCGFFRYSDFLYTTALSVLCASRQFPKVEMVANDFFIEMFKKLKLPITSYSNKMNDMKDVSRFFWAYGKLMAYCEQTEPFIHLDNDVFLWQKFPKRILNAELCFQSHEPMNVEGYKYYDMLRPCFAAAPIKPQKIVDNEVTDFAYNCGICGGHNLDFFHEWKECSEEYIFAEENQLLFYQEYANVLIHQNLFHEQYFAASLIKMHGMRNKVQVLAEDAMEIDKKIKYTHLWGTTKKGGNWMSRVFMRLYREDEDLHKRVTAFLKKNKIP